MSPQRQETQTNYIDKLLPSCYPLPKRLHRRGRFQFKRSRSRNIINRMSSHPNKWHGQRELIAHFMNATFFSCRRIISEDEHNNVSMCPSMCCPVATRAANSRFLVEITPDARSLDIKRLRECPFNAILFCRKDSYPYPHILWWAVHLLQNQSSTCFFIGRCLVVVVALVRAKIVGTFSSKQFLPWGNILPANDIFGLGSYYFCPFAFRANPRQIWAIARWT